MVDNSGKWYIYPVKPYKITVTGKTLESALKNWAKKQGNGKEVSCGILVRVMKKGESIWKYWSGEQFMRCFDN